MPGWLALICAVLVVVTGGYLFYVVMRPDRF